MDEKISTKIDLIEGLISNAKEIGETPNNLQTKTNLIAVSKTYIGEQILPALECGHLNFGENRVQEALEKWPPLKRDFPKTKLHLIGPLQTNKAKEAISLFDAIHTLDRPKLAHVLKNQIEKQYKPVDIFIQVNTGAEPQKNGLLPNAVDQFIEDIKPLRLPIVGLMCIPPANEEPSPHFALLKKIADRNGLNRLSMGMSSDFEKAVQFGATDIRVGSAIFGVRD